jgi:hypothetical protein
MSNKLWIVTFFLFISLPTNHKKALSLNRSKIRLDAKNDEKHSTRKSHLQQQHYTTQVLAFDESFNLKCRKG